MQDPLAKEAGYELSDEDLQAVSGGDWGDGRTEYECYEMDPTVL